MQMLGGSPQRLPQNAAPTTSAAAIATFHCNGCPVVTSSNTVDKMGVANASRPIRLVSPHLIAAFHRKNAPPKGLGPRMQTSTISCVVNAMAGSNSTWQTRESKPEAAAKPPTAEVGNADNLRVSSE